MVSIWERPYIACKTILFKWQNQFLRVASEALTRAKYLCLKSYYAPPIFSNNDVKKLWNIQFGERLTLKYTTTYATYRDLNYSTMLKTRDHHARNRCDLFERVYEGMLLFCIIFDADIISLTRFDICWKCALDSRREDFKLYDVLILE